MPDLSAAQTPLKQAAHRGELSQGSLANLDRWLTQPGYEDYRPRILQLIDSARFRELEQLFWTVIPFGTGGRRGPMGEFGTATINPRTIAESAHGLAAYLKKVKPAGGRAVVAHDTRNRSPEFARITASTLAAHGLKVFFFPEHRSTPELSLAVRHLACDVGVMISASHNPPADNGFKAYWSSGAQVLSPHDKGIIDAVQSAAAIPHLDFDAALSSGKIELVTATVDEAYWSAVLSMSLSPHRDLPALFSPLHGVGETSCFQILQRAGFTGVRIFEPHRLPSGDFPRVPDHLPNPERKQVFDPLIAAAGDAELLLASDPDADRLGACVRDRDGQFVHLSGNQIGVLLVDYILRKRKARGDLSPQHFIVETLVTTPLVAALGRRYGLRVVDDLLVGFKYIAQTMDALGPDKFVFGTEESLGYLAGTYARDKDAGIAALYLCEAAAELRREKLSLLDRLDQIYLQEGFHLEDQISRECTGAKGNDQIKLLMHTLRNQPPHSLAGINLTSVRDFAAHEVRSLPDNRKSADLPQPSGDLLMFSASAQGLSIGFAARPSGTEPKIKFYFFARADVPSADSLPAVKSDTRRRLTNFQNALKSWMDSLLQRNS